MGVPIWNEGTTKRSLPRGSESPDMLQPPGASERPGMTNGNSDRVHDDMVRRELEQRINESGYRLVPQVRSRVQESQSQRGASERPGMTNGNSDPAEQRRGPDVWAQQEFERLTSWGLGQIARNQESQGRQGPQDQQRRR
ncbi:MAG TPA: hypothetical protein VGN34_12645 [Ktedonobacteraceae bacterium]|jgi:hypothetical protein